MIWKPGDIALIQFTCSHTVKLLPHIQGRTCILLKYMGSLASEVGSVGDSWHVNAEGTEVYVNERVLKKPPYDGHEKTTWDQIKKTIGYSPKVLERVE